MEKRKKKCWILPHVALLENPIDRLNLIKVLALKCQGQCSRQASHIEAHLEILTEAGHRDQSRVFPQLPGIQGVVQGHHSDLPEVDLEHQIGRSEVLLKLHTNQTGAIRGRRGGVAA